MKTGKKTVVLPAKEQSSKGANVERDYIVVTGRAETHFVELARLRERLRKRSSVCLRGSLNSAV